MTPLSDDDFRKVVDLTPLVAMDLLVKDASGRVLLGLRRNRPARGDWFVPGGRVYKGERLDDAFARITRSELGVACKRSEAQLLDVFEHLYEDSFFGDAGPGPSTHYVVLAYLLPMVTGMIVLPDEQHSHYRWEAVADAIKDESVHEYSRAYFRHLLQKPSEERAAL